MNTRRRVEIKVPRGPYCTVIHMTFHPN